MNITPLNSQNKLKHNSRNEYHVILLRCNPAKMKESYSKDSLDHETWKCKIPNGLKSQTLVGIQQS